MTILQRSKELYAKFINWCNTKQSSTVICLVYSAHLMLYLIAAEVCWWLLAFLGVLLTESVLFCQLVGKALLVLGGTVGCIAFLLQLAMLWFGIEAVFCAIDDSKSLGRVKRFLLVGGVALLACGLPTLFYNGDATDEAKMRTLRELGLEILRLLSNYVVIIGVISLIIRHRLLKRHKKHDRTTP